MLKMSPVLQHQHTVDVRCENVKKATCCDAGLYDLVSYCKICGRELSSRTLNTPMRVMYMVNQRLMTMLILICGSIQTSILLLNARFAAATCSRVMIQNPLICVLIVSGRYLSLTPAELCPGKWSESLQDDEDTYDQSSEIEKILIESNLYEGMEYNRIIKLPIYHQMRKIGYDYSKRHKSFGFIGLTQEKGE